MNRSARVDDSVMTTSLRDTGCQGIARNWSYIGQDTFIGYNKRFAYVATG